MPTSPNKAGPTTSPRYTLRCECGSLLNVDAGKAGLVVPCPSCGHQVLVPSLSSLRKLPAIESPGPPQRVANRPFQYQLRHMLVLMLCWAVVLAIGRYVGFVELTWLIVSFLIAVTLILGVASLMRFLRKGTYRFWDFWEQHRSGGRKEP